MTVTVRQLAELVGGELTGCGDISIERATPLDESTTGDITFVENDRQLGLLDGCRASAAVVPKNTPTNGKALIRVADPLLAFIAIVRQLQGRVEPPVHGVDPRASVDPSAKLGPDCSVLPFAVVGAGAVLGARCRIHSGAVVGPNCRLGDDVVLYPNCVLYEGTVLGQRVIVHANAVLGADGFGYRFQGGKHVKVPQLGHLEIGDDVEIGACTTIDRGTFKATRIGNGAKIDNLVQVGHNCQIGNHNLLVSQVGIGGSTSSGDYVVLAGQVGIVDHVHIGAGAVIGAKSGVINNIPAGQRYFGIPATPARDQKRILSSLDKLVEMRKDVRRIKQKLGLSERIAEEA